MPNLTNPDLLDPNQDDNPSMSADEFAGLLAEVGIPREFAMDVWTTFADRFTDPAYTGAQAMLDIYDEDALKDVSQVSPRCEKMPLLIVQFLLLVTI